MKIIEKIINKIGCNNLSRDFNDLKILIAQQIIKTNNQCEIKNINETEFKVFSQWGEDGIIQFLINKLPIENKVFIEFGVENYKESNTRFLLMNNNWSGLVIDGDEKNIKYIIKDDIYWKYDLVAKAEFINKENINIIIDDYIKNSNFNRNIGLLSIDLDGNDYHIWENIKVIDPIIVICEYNWIFGNKKSLTVPYDNEFNRTKKHYSNLYFGASINALYCLAKKKGYEYLGCTSAGNDAIFVKKPLAEQFLSNIITTPEKHFHIQKAKEARNRKGKLTFLRGKDRLNEIKDLEVLDIESNSFLRIGDI